MQIIQTLHDAGHVALLAGGCVRDRLLNREPKDYDVVTDATPPRVVEIFPRARKVGAQFGVILVRRYGYDIEVATFRSEGPYSDGRHPDAVTFGTDVEDAKRRDFTINGLFFDPLEQRVIDYVNGQADLGAGIIRTIGDPDVQFAEDHLRMLRAVRLAARLEFQIDAPTLSAIRRLAPHLESISAERVWMELEMILTDPSRARGWGLLLETGLRGHVSAEWPADAEHDRLAQARLAALPPHRLDAPLPLAAVLRDLKPATAARVCRALRLSNRLTVAVVWMVRSLPRVRHDERLDLADLKLLMAEEAWPGLLELLRVDLIAKDASAEPYDRLRRRTEAIPPEQVAPPPLVTGDDLLALGISPGPKVGKVLRDIYRAQLNEQVASRDEAMALARTLAKAE